MAETSRLWYFRLGSGSETRRATDRVARWKDGARSAIKFPRAAEVCKFRWSMRPAIAAIELVREQRCEWWWLW